MQINVPNNKVYSGENSTIIHGNAVDILPLIPDESIDLIFADPPYNIGKKIGEFVDKWATMDEYTNWCYSWLQDCIRILKPEGSMYVMTSTQSMPFLDLWLRDRVYIKSRIVWHYDSSGVQAKKHFGSLYEPILHCTKHNSNYTFNADDVEIEAKTGAVRGLIDYRKKIPTQYKSTKVPGNTWYFPRVRYRMPEYENHPSQKPRLLLERIIKASSRKGDLVLDPFSGTFTTSYVAQKLQRRSIGIEMQLPYIKVGIRILGIATHFNGEKLEEPRKDYRIKNKTQANTKKEQGNIFDDRA